MSSRCRCAEFIIVTSTASGTETVGGPRAGIDPLLRPAPCGDKHIQLATTAEHAGAAPYGRIVVEHPRPAAVAQDDENSKTTNPVSWHDPTFHRSSANPANALTAPAGNHQGQTEIPHACGPFTASPAENRYRALEDSRGLQGLRGSHHRDYDAESARERELGDFVLERVSGGYRREPP